MKAKEENGKKAKIKFEIEISNMQLKYNYETTKKKRTKEKDKKAVIETDYFADASDKEADGKTRAERQAALSSTPDGLPNRESKQFEKELQSILRKNFITWSIAITILIIADLFLYAYTKEILNWMIFPVILVICGLAILINSRRFIFIDYRIGDDVSDRIKQRNKALSYLNSCLVIWRIKQSEHIINSKTNAGAATSLKRGYAKFNFKKAPMYLKIKGGWKIYQLSIGKMRYLFLPDKLLIVNLYHVRTVNYSTVTVNLKDVQFIESGKAPEDALFLYNTWQYVNVDGSRDMRYNGNKMLPVYAYKDVHFSSIEGLNAYIMVSSSYSAEKFKETWDSMMDLDIETDGIRK